MNDSKHNHLGFTVIELLVVIGIITALLAILLPAIERVRHQAYIDKCASNLHQIGIALTLYEGDNHGQSARTMYDPAAPIAQGTGVTAPDPFLPGGPAANDITASVFLVLKSEKITPAIFICPYNDDTEYVADSADFKGRCNFTNYKKNLAYSFANPYPNAAAVAAGYRLASNISAGFAIASDLNPGVGKNSDVYKAAPNATKSVMDRANSANHEREGQNVLFADGHVAWHKTPFVGLSGDNIFTSKIGVAPAVEASPADANDSILLPEGGD